MDWYRRLQAFYRVANQAKGWEFVRHERDPYQVARERVWSFCAKDATDFAAVLPALRSVELAPMLDTGQDEFWYMWQWFYLSESGTIELRDWSLAVLLVADVIGL